MSRSKHTRPRAIRAADRLRKPREPRGADDASRTRALLRELKEAGVSVPSLRPRADEPWPLPRLIEKRPRPEHHHPATRANVADLLRFCGEECVYGLLAVELRQGAPGGTGLQLGQLMTPGRIVLYDQRVPPWRLRGTVPEEEEARLTRAGARLDPLEGGGLQIEWPGDTLRDFMLFDVLMHEVGHHLIQQHKGKRRARMVRTRDHEAFADAFARRWREVWLQGLSDPQ